MHGGHAHINIRKKLMNFSFTTNFNKEDYKNYIMPLEHYLVIKHVLWSIYTYKHLKN